MRIAFSKRIIPGLLIVIISLWPVGCTKRVVTDPQTGQSTTQAVVTDDTLHQISVQIRRAIEGVQTIGAVKRGLFKQHTISASQSRAVTVASQDALKALNEINEKLAGYTQLDEATRAELTPLISNALDLSLKLGSAISGNLPGSASRANDAKSAITGAVQDAQRLLKGGN